MKLAITPTIFMAGPQGCSYAFRRHPSSRTQPRFLRMGVRDLLLPFDQSMRS